MGGVRFGSFVGISDRGVLLLRQLRKLEDFEIDLSLAGVLPSSLGLDSGANPTRTTS